MTIANNALKCLMSLNLTYFSIHQDINPANSTNT